VLSIKAMADIEITVTDGIATILLNRPEQRNAFTVEMIDEWARFLVSARTDDSVAVVVVTGATGAFCSGGDFAVITDANTALAQKRLLQEHIQRVPLALDDLDKPVLAAVNGAAVGAGMDMALMCDIRYASRSARFSEGYIKVGLVPGDGGCFYLPRLVGIGRALELLFTGDFVDAEEAERIGIVNKVFEDDELVPATMALARRLADSSPIALRAIKRTTYQSARVDLRTALDLASSHFGVISVTEDAGEAMSSFRERRPATYQDR
jgi:enoyl-CoA hydratase/carnithine racemase